MKRLLPLLLAGAVLASCDSGAMQADGTSSETQTALQALADNSFAISARLAPSLRPPAIAARALSAEQDSTFGLIEERWCSGASESWYGGFLGEIRLAWNSPGVGPDGASSSCSLKESIHTGREFQVDSLGRWDARFVRRQYDTLQRSVFQGSGTWGLRSGLILTYRALFADISTSKAIFRQEIELLGVCRLDLSFTDSLTDTGWTAESIDAPLVCGGKPAGRFLWDRANRMRVLDIQGKIVSPRRLGSQRFAEDTLGLRAQVVGFQAEPLGSLARVRLETRMRFLDWDSLAVPRWIMLVAPGEPERVLDSVLWSGKAVDTLEFSVSSTDMEAMGKSNRLFLWAPFDGYRGGARSMPLRF